MTEGAVKVEGIKSGGGLEVEKEAMVAINRDLAKATREEREVVEILVHREEVIEVIIADQVTLQVEGREVVMDNNVVVVIGGKEILMEIVSQMSALSVTEKVTLQENVLRMVEMIGEVGTKGEKVVAISVDGRKEDLQGMKTGDTYVFT